MHVEIARGYGLEGERVSHPDEINSAVLRAVAAEREGRAYVLDVIIIDRRGGGADAGWQELPAQLRTLT